MVESPDTKTLEGFFTEFGFKSSVGYFHHVIFIQQTTSKEKKKEQIKLDNKRFHLHF